jgi:O-antigen ligase
MAIAQHRLARAMMVGRRLVFVKTAASDAVAGSKIPRIVEWSFLLFIGAMVLDMYSSAKISGVMLFAVYFLYNNPLARNRHFPPISPLMLWFLIYVTVYALQGLFIESEYVNLFITRLVTLVQSIVFLWIASDILKHEKMAYKTLRAFALASFILAVGFVFSLPGFNVIGEVGTTRASAIGASANVVGPVMALAMVVVLGLWLNLSQKGLGKAFLMSVAMLALSAALVNTGARTGVLMAMIGLSVYLVPYWKSRWRLSSAIIGVIVIAGFAYMALNSVVFSSRWRDFSETGDTSGRDAIYADALSMISERPFFGWQPIEFEYELGSRNLGVRSPKAAHNLYLHLFTEVGAVGAVPFLIGLGLCGSGAWKARGRNLGLLPLALLVTIIAGGMGLNIIYQKTIWFVLAVTIAATTEKKRPAIILVGRSH